MNTPYQPTPLSPAQVAAIEAWNQRQRMARAEYRLVPNVVAHYMGRWER